MDKMTFSAAEKADVVDKIKAYFTSELSHDIGTFEAEFLIDFFAEELGGHYYNQGLYDAQALFLKKVDEMSDSIVELEMATSPKR